MCSPAAVMQVAQIGTSIASTAAEDSAKNRAAEAVQKNAESDLFNKYNATQAREHQEMVKAQLETFNVTQQAKSTSSRIRAAAGSGGVVGSTVTARSAQPGIQAANVSQTINQNLANTLRQNQLDAKSYQAEAQSKINEAQSEKVSPGMEALAIGNDVVKGVTGSGLLPQGGLPGAGKTPDTTTPEQGAAAAQDVFTSGY